MNNGLATEDTEVTEDGSNCAGGKLGRSFSVT
ncbi:hypothetical protein LCGC14_2349100, partial [marine sediment metagenome]